MRGLDIELNGKRFCVAGVQHKGMVNAIVDVVSRTQTEFDMHIRVGGMAEDDLVLWKRADLQIGDELVFRVVERSSMDAPTERKPVESSTQF